jgi:hypothetical protein
MSDAFQNDVLAEETHSGRAWGVIVLLALIAPAIGVALVPSTAGRWAVAIVGVLSIGTFAMAWSGFQYRFLRGGDMYLGIAIEIWVIAGLVVLAILFLMSMLAPLIPQGGTA